MAEDEPAPADLFASLLDWYDRQRRDLPWRAPSGAAADPYRVLVSEFMLQQTTAATVRRRFPAFVARFPDLPTLARAPLDDVLHGWQGLGYYRRARALHACAQAIVAEHHGELPHDEEALRRLPGVGPYTSAALRAIVHGVGPVPVDGNVERVLIRLYAIDAPRPEAGRAARDRARSLVAADRTGDVAQAMMELGATVCRPRGPACSLCPWLDVCRARRLGLTDVLPRAAARADRPSRRGVAFVLQRRDGAVLFRQRPPRGLLAGLHDLPGSDWVAGALDLDEAVRAAPASADWRLVPGRVRHVFTHFALELTVLRAVTDTPPLGLWCQPDELVRLALPTVAVKVLRHTGLATAAVAEARRPARSG